MDKELRFRTTKNRFSNSLNSIKKETKLRELRKITTKGINNRDRLETEVKEKEELQMQGEAEATKLLADSNIGKILVDELLAIDQKDQKDWKDWKYQDKQLKQLKNILFKKKIVPHYKTYNKSLILYVNHALLGFYFC